jgi:hypothetical protein
MPTLTPSPRANDQLQRIRSALRDPGTYCVRRQLQEEMEPMEDWTSRAVLIALEGRDHKQ